MDSDSRSRQEIVRGILILGVFHIHAMYTLSYSVGAPDLSPLAWLQIKVFSPLVAAFFVFAGMSSKRLAERPTHSVLSTSLMLWLLTVVSHLLGIGLSYLVYEDWVSWRAFAKAMIKPIVYGTGYATFVCWFFTVLAMTRILVHLLIKRPLAFLTVVLSLIILLLVAHACGRPDNLHEWRNWPAAVALFLIGMRIPDSWKIPHWAGALGLVAAISIGLINSPTLLTLGPAWNREPNFVAEPMIGRFGFAPLYFLEVAASIVFLLWLGRAIHGTVAARVLKYFGTYSLQFLFLHGLALVSLYPIATRLFPARESIPLFLVFLILNPAVHALIYLITRRPIHWLISTCGHLANRLMKTIASRERVTGRSL